MKVLIHNGVHEDIKKCSRKKWYIGIRNELPRIIKLLEIKGSMPGESPFHYVPKELESKTYHAGICLPNCGMGKRKGPRVIFHKDYGEGVIKILYIGGHKDKRYNDSYQIVNILASRFFTEGFSSC